MLEHGASRTEQDGFGNDPEFYVREYKDVTDLEYEDLFSGFIKVFRGEIATGEAEYGHSTRQQEVGESRYSSVWDLLERGEENVPYHLPRDGAESPVLQQPGEGAALSDMADVDGYEADTDVKGSLEKFMASFRERASTETPGEDAPDNLSSDDAECPVLPQPEETAVLFDIAEGEGSDSTESAEISPLNSNESLSDALGEDEVCDGDEAGSLELSTCCSVLWSIPEDENSEDSRGGNAPPPRPASN